MTKAEKALAVAIIAVWFLAAGFIIGKNQPNPKSHAEGFAAGHAEGTLAGGVATCNDIFNVLKGAGQVGEVMECVPYQGQVSITAPTIPDAPHFHPDGTKF